ncbi:MAG: hypothetical protein HDS99_03835 [Bacteroidales bacterium]|nr:hypothetical protein [Bacteroidales bacterium]
MSELELSPVAIRIKDFIEYLQISNSQFADKAGIPRPTLSQLLHGRNKTISDLLIQKLHDAFPDLNLMWLLFGKGDMIVNIQNQMNLQGNENETLVNSVTKEDNSMANDQLFSYMVSPADDSSAPTQPKTEAYPKEGDKSEVPSGTNPKNRRVKSIIVFYTDNSFQTFYPE